MSSMAKSVRSAENPGAICPVRSAIPSGAELPGKAPGEPTFKIKKAKLRGQDSHGMICAEDELGLGQSQSPFGLIPSNSTELESRRA